MIRKKFISTLMSVFFFFFIYACSSNKQAPSGQGQTGVLQQEGQGQQGPAEPSDSNLVPASNPTPPKGTCSSDADCLGGQVCLVDLQQCAAPPPPSECLSDQDCGVGETCDSSSKHCVSSNPAQASTDDDGVKDGSETDVDCGGTNPNKCGAGKSCNGDSDCNLADKCSNGSCALKNPPQVCSPGCTGECKNGQCITVLPPKCVLTSPKDGEDRWGTGFSGTSAIKVTFSEPMDKTTINENTFIVQKTSGGGHVKGGIVLIGNDDVALFAQNQNLEANTQYMATITTGVKNKQGVALEQEFRWFFTTSNAVAAVTPKRDADKLLPSLDKISVKFETPVDKSAFSKDSLVLSPAVSIKSVKQENSKEISFELAKDLKEDTTYTATLKKEDVLAAQYLWSFSTRDCPDPELTLSWDSQRCSQGLDWQYDECGCDGGGTGGCEVGFSCGDIMVNGGLYVMKWETKNVVSVTEDCHLINKNWNVPSNHSGTFQFPWDGPKPGGGDPTGFSFSAFLKRFLGPYLDPTREALAAGGNAAAPGDRFPGKFHCTVRATGACGKEIKKTYHYSCP